MPRNLTEQEYNLLIGEWLDRELNDFLDWFQVSNPRISTKQLDAFARGFRDGWQSAVAILDQKGFVLTSTRKG
jgi:hypothetical protein